MPKNRHRSGADPGGKGGFTLIELLVTVAIIGILVAISVPLYVGQQRKAAMSEAQTNLRNLRLLLEQTFADRGCYCVDPADSTCKATAAPITGVVAIQGWWPRFQPGFEKDLNYTYSVQCPAIATPPGRPATNVSPFNNGGSFTAIAKPKVGTVVGRKDSSDRSGDLWINDRNESNIQ